MMKGKEYLERLNALEEGMREERDSVFEMYGDHSDDAELCWSQFRKSWDDEIDKIAEKAWEDGFPVKYDKESQKWILK